MYGIHNMEISVLPDALGMNPVVYRRPVPAWLVAEHYDHCENGFFGRLRRFFFTKQ